MGFVCFSPGLLSIVVDKRKKKKATEHGDRDADGGLEELRLCLFLFSDSKRKEL